MKLKFFLFSFLLSFSIGFSQQSWDELIEQKLPSVLIKHKAFASIPNVSSVEEDMYKNIAFIQPEFEKLGFNVSLLESTTLPVFLAEKVIDKNLKTVLFYLHLDGQPVDASKWNQENPFIPVLKEQTNDGHWNEIDWNAIEGSINPEWRVFGRATADDKGPILMLLTAIELLEKENKKLGYNIKVVLDLEEETSSDAFISTIDTYKNKYAADYMIIMDGPAHNSNKPTLTFGCRGITTFDLTVYGAKFPQHSGHYGNYAPNPIFSLGNILTGMKDKSGKVLIDGYYDGIEITPEITSVLETVPDDETIIKKTIGIAKADHVGNTYQESLQYPSLNVRHIETSWKGPGLKTIVPEYVRAYFDIRLVSETDGDIQLEKVKNHLVKEGYYVIERDPTDEERLTRPNIIKFNKGDVINAFRTDSNSTLGKKLTEAITEEFVEKPVSIRTMGGTVPIVPAINSLQIPAIIFPLVNMDNNQHNPNENLRIGNMSQGIKMCMIALTLEL